MAPKHPQETRLIQWEKFLLPLMLQSYLWLLAPQLQAQPNLPHLTKAQLNDQDPENAKGWLLMNELGCFQCHAQESEFSSSLPNFDAPDLTEVSSRLKQGFVIRFIQNPNLAHPGTRMPSVMEHLTKEQKSETAQHITAYLWSLSTHKNLDSRGIREIPQGQPNRGRELFMRIGCTTCHPPLQTSSLDQSGSLLHVKTKYRFNGLQQFLLQPQKVRKGFRMPDFNLSPMEASDLAAYLLAPEHNDADQSFEGDPEIGRHLLTQFHCSQCHSDVDDRQPPLPIAHFPTLELLNQGCLASNPTEHSPWYGLSTYQTDLIRAALTQVQEPKSSTFQPGLDHHLTILQCNACHQRSPLLPLSADHEAFFSTSGEDLEDEGRIPPSLDGVGRKLTQAALVSTVRGEMPVRPYMHTRMPNWGSTHATFLANKFSDADQIPNEKPTPRNGEENQVGRNMWGRSLMGTEGLGCIQCHSLQGNRSLGIQAIDLMHVSKRLRAPWFRDYLLDPSKFRPGTRMPAFWPDGKPSIPGHGGSTSRQIDSLWVYLNELDQSRLPAGMETKGDYKLVPDEKPIVFRTFMEDAGLHAIAVGFPQNYHVALDAQSCLWKVAWKGPFIDAEATWDDRFTPLTQPLGETLPWFPNLNTQWSKHGRINHAPSNEIDSEFLGYRLDAEGVPTFHYRLNNVQVEDRIQALEDGLKRTLRFPNGSTDLHLLIYESSTITRKQDLLVDPEQECFIEIKHGSLQILEKNTHLQVWLSTSPQKESNLEYILRENSP